MNHTAFYCDSRLDVAFIPFMPACTLDTVELRVQIRALRENALLDTVIRVDGEVIHNAVEQSVEKFYFFSDNRRYSAGEHSLSICYKESSSAVFEECTHTFLIEEDRKPLLSGGFVMLGPPNDRIPCKLFTSATKQMTDGDWERYLDELALLGIRCIIITTTVQLRTMQGENTAHYTSELYPRSDIRANDPIRAILRAAERNGQFIFIGLGHTYYNGSITNTPQIMDELYALYGDSPAFYGWYESEEANIRMDQTGIWDRWRYIREHAASLSPVKPFLVSPYTHGENVYQESGGIHPEFLRRLSNGEAAFDIIAPQDMVGHSKEGGRLTVKESAQMFYHLSLACAAAQKHLWANCEAFDFNEENLLVPRFNGGGMNGENGFIQQIEAVTPYTEKTVTFMLNGFFAPEGFAPIIGGKAAIKQCEDYRKYRMSIEK